MALSLKAWSTTTSGICSFSSTHAVLRRTCRPVVAPPFVRRTPASIQCTAARKPHLQMTHVPAELGALPSDSDSEWSRAWAEYPDCVPEGCHHGRAPSEPKKEGAAMKSVSLGTYLGCRLLEVGVKHAFGVPGDFNLSLLDELAKKHELELMWCCNELNAGYAADGYARANGVGAVVVTFGVGGFSVINAIAGAYAEDLPVIVISGGPNSNDYATNHILHHTIGKAEYDQQMRAFKEVTCAQVLVQHMSEAHHQIDYAISEALRQRKPVYLEICCNLAGLSHPSLMDPPVHFVLPCQHTNPSSLQAAVDMAAQVLNSCTKPVLLAGPGLRAYGRRPAFEQLADASQYAVAVTPDGKGMFSEDHGSFIGTYWGQPSSPSVCEVVESSDTLVVVGCAWTDYSTVGYSLLLQPNKLIEVCANRVTIQGGATFGCIAMQDFLHALAARLQPNPTSMVNFKRMHVPELPPMEQAVGEVLNTKVLFKHVQELLGPDTVLLTEVGDSWFNSQRLHLPRGCGYEMQLRYGSIGWSVGATLGYQMAAAPRNKRVVALIGDGSFQMTAQEVSTMLRFGACPIIILINNGGYTIEAEIHDGPYNIIQNWDYLGMVQSLHNGQGKLWVPDHKITNEQQLVQALSAASSHMDCLAFLEVCLHRDDCSAQLLEFGARVCAANSRPPHPH